MARKKAASIAKKIAIVGIPLIIIELGYILLWNKSETTSVQQVINQAVSKVGKADDRRKALLKIQLSLSNFMQANQGRPPKTLDELRPKYFDVLPIDPVTGQQFLYKVENNRPIVGYNLSLAEDTTRRPAAVRGPAAGGATAVPALPELIETAFVYDPSAKRDPFRPFDFAPKPTERTGRTPLERYEYGQLKLTAVLEGLDEPQAIIENAIGRGFTVKKGTKVGPYGGEIVEILKDRVLILENTVDFTGEKKSKTIELRLRTKDQEKKLDELRESAQSE